MAADANRAPAWEEPPDWQEGPRVSGPFTFMRIPPGRNLNAGDVAIVGVPFDAGTALRPGARFGPRGLRTASAHLRPYPRKPDGLFPPCDQLRVLD
jgi:arginase family enzyme